MKSVSLHSTLAELGMDSMMAVEIKQTLEREYEIFLTPQDIRGMTFAKLQDIAASKSQSPDKTADENSILNIFHFIRFKTYYCIKITVAFGDHCIRLSNGVEDMHLWPEIRNQTIWATNYSYTN